MESGARSPGPCLAIYACASCRQRKRKCDKLLPRCSLCSKKNLTCLYSNSSVPPPFSSSSDGFLPNGTPAIETPKFPAVFFLDSDLFQQAQIDISRVEAPIPRYILDLIGDFSQWRSIATKFFETVHTFMPIVSKPRLYGRLLNPLAPRRSDVALLLLCMRLITMLPAGALMSRTPEYIAAKRFHTELELTGGFSPQVLQAGVLIALHEYGHAIYPAAYLTIGGLARYGISSGIDGTGPSQMPPPSDWIEAEERKRIWWAVLILDREVSASSSQIAFLTQGSAVNLGNPTRTLAIQEPPSSSILPMDDELWDQGVPMPNEPFTLSSPSSLKIGRFARFSQAVFLLGRVYKHVSDYTTNKEFLDEEATQLRRTLQALAKIVEIEGQSKKLQFCTQVALCYSGMLLIQESYSALAKVPSPDVYFWDPSIPVAESIAKESARIAVAFMTLKGPLPFEEVSPFILHLFYCSQTIFAEKARIKGSESALQTVEVLTRVFRVMNERWKAADEYLEILKARELTYFS